VGKVAKVNGRGQLVPLTWWAKLLAWLKANPLWGLIAALVAAVGVSSLRIGHLTAKQAKAQKAADLAALERNKLEVKAREHALETRLVLADAKAKKADIADAKAKATFDAAQKDIEGVAARWKKKKKP
jgi:uncharacterized membrane protein